MRTPILPPDQSALLHPAELARLAAALTEGLDPHGRAGANRAKARVAQLGTDSDLEAIALFLREYAESPHTRRAYTKECERLVLWAVTERRKALSDLDRGDLQDYLAFLQDPRPAAVWVATRTRRWIAGIENPAWRPTTKRLADGTLNPHWRPFNGGLSPASQRAAIGAINSLFNYLVDAGHLDGNPLRLMRRKQKLVPTVQRRKQGRVLSEVHWRAVTDALDTWPTATPRARATAARARWITWLYFSLGLRLSEAESHTMGHFTHEGRGGASEWWFRALGKGNKERTIPVPDVLLEELRRYRAYLELFPALPVPQEPTSLLLSLKGQRAITADRAARILKDVFKRASWRVDDAERPRLLAASVHWLRHTYGTTLWDNGVDPRNIQDNLGHASFETTMTYAHGEDARRHRETRTLGQPSVADNAEADDTA